jgi:hypothetical protein
MKIVRQVSSKPTNDRARELDKDVRREISDHFKWCSPECDTFLPEAYRRARIALGCSAEEVQNDYDLCHIFR